MQQEKFDRPPGLQAECMNVHCTLLAARFSLLWGGEDGGEERGVWGGCVTKIVRYFTLLQIRNEQIDPDPVLFIQPFLVNF